MTTEQYLIIAIASLATAVGHLYWRMDGLHKQCEKERKECEEQNDKLWDRLSRLERTQS